ncbi:hypothetical protein RD792_014767 [Penstemon davidsonii]|uniref:Protein kinase domain-containing protein n=1 Tax=Penstemon davidsonii TaxID=160366 RepID=A0ABR0CS22_9LAMI|nr:hypothetical protein RD792_014767 [Penstemon davidsonii]
MEIPMMSFNLIFSLIVSASICMFLNLSFPEYASGNETDRLSLLAFKSQINEDPLGILTSWSDSSHYCNWTGVTCQSQIPRVTGLNLTRQRLAGMISSHIGNLSFIDHLDLSGNSFNGEIPEELGNLGRLQILNVSNNLLRGPIPYNLSNCINLTNLALDHNYLIGNVPHEIGSLSKLLTLNLGSNNLTGNIEPSIGNLTFLRELDMSYNSLNGEVPNTISQLKNLKVFRVSVNSLSGEFPPSLYNLTSLEFIALSFNNFTGNLRNDIGFLLPNLQRIWLPFNFFTGTIPSSFSNASKLYNIDLIRNNFTGKVPLDLGKLDLLQLRIGSNFLGNGEEGDLDFITSLTNCTNLNILNIGANRFGGLLPISIANLSTQLRVLYLQENLIHGNIPEQIMNLQSLYTLFMHSNNLNGIIPDSFGMLPNLGRLVLGSNQLTGQIPSSIGNMTSLTWLFLFDNKLEGGIPTSLANCKQLVFIWIAQNNLTGIIPQEIFGISSLLSFNVSLNSLTGPLPENVGNSSHLVEIDLSYNKFSGEISNNIGNCLVLNIIFLHGNMFQGSIPYLARLHNLNYLDLSSNNLSGNIPDYFVDLPSFLYLNLSFNDLEGEVPSTGVFSNLSATDIHENHKLCGGIPELQLPVCPQQEPEKGNKKHRKKHVKKLIVIVVITSFAALLLFLLMIFCTRKRLKSTPETESTSLKFYPKVSYEELRNATDGFSSENLIGSGSFGIVYKGNLGPNGLAVAVKVINLEQKGGSKSFISECLALKNIRHHNLVKVITVCSSTDFHGNEFKALVYQLMSNGSLDQWLHPEEETPHHNRLNIIQRIDIAIDIASALYYLHHQCQTPVIHCDLKPQNVLLDSDLTAHVGDFGLARLFPKSSMKDNANSFSSLGIKGTIGYAAPEYGMGVKASILGDVYSFGILLLEIFTGKRPTDKLFQENLNLHHYVKKEVPDKVTEVLDSSALCEEVTGEAKTWDEAWSSLISEQRECLIYILQIGVACSIESPRDRMSMRQVCRELSSIRDTFLHTGFLEEKDISLSNRDADYVDAV